MMDEDVNGAEIFGALMIGSVLIYLFYMLPCPGLLNQEPTQLDRDAYTLQEAARKVSGQ